MQVIQRHLPLSAIVPMTLVFDILVRFNLRLHHGASVTVRGLVCKQPVINSLCAMVVLHAISQPAGLVFSSQLCLQMLMAQQMDIQESMKKCHMETSSKPSRTSLAG